jgi:hypothetical protein
MDSKKPTPPHEPTEQERTEELRKIVREAIEEQRSSGR